ncbi:hypothetical protein QLQ12_17435 [Actinoplanes sp. NEAU-A12]|uniref:Uncharacterized protein n=2 Tax=Actinoplanes sandaracinus TaxID=3045177 RepID=A0ABT6WKZ3_9ACTN|nr:hypothetical protein [Actinoplanes sandaracinus]
MLAPDGGEKLIEGGGSCWVLSGPARIDGKTVSTARVVAATPVRVGDTGVPLLVLELVPETSVAEVPVPSETWLEAAVQAWADRSGLPENSDADARVWCFLFGRLGCSCKDHRACHA